MHTNPFSKQHSLAVKGAAILMMLWHHCFLKGRFEDFSIRFWPLTQPQAATVAAFFKICVSLFAFISGYGLFLSYRKAHEKGGRTTGWILEKLMRTLSGYWFVVLLSWAVCGFLDGMPYRAYGFERSWLLGVWNMAVEFFGLSNLFGNAPMNATWWYMSAAVSFILLLPALFLLFEKAGGFCTAGIILLLPRLCMEYPGGINPLTFLPVFCFGMLFAKADLFSKWDAFWAARGRVAGKFLRPALLLFLLLLCYKLSAGLSTSLWWDVKLGLFPIIAVLFVRDCAFPIPGVRQVLVFLGKHSTNIFLTHTFIRYYYCRDFIYGWEHFAAVLFVLLLLSLGLSLLIEGLKKATKYNALIESALKRLTGSA